MNKISEIKKSIRYVCKKNILVIIMIILLCPVLAVSYSSFIKNTGTFRASEMFIGNLLYSLKIDGTSRNTITVAPGETEAVIEVTSLNAVSSNYKVVYATNSNVSVIYAVDENEPTYGIITNTKTSSILITNSSTENITITFDIAGGYVTDELANVLANAGYTEVTSNYMKYDYETLAMFVSGVRVSSLDSSKAYNLLSYTCTNGETVTWSNLNHSIIVNGADQPTKCRLYFEETVWDVFTSYSCANISSGTSPYTLTYTGNCTVTSDEYDNWKVKFLTSGQMTLLKNQMIDIFVVGGGGGSTGYYGSSGGSGGAGGYTNTYRNIGIISGYSYDIVIGSGGAASSTGGKSYFGTESTYYANGGGTGKQDGGSGGGAGTNKSVAGAGGSDGKRGGMEAYFSIGGYGQGVTTREFGENNGQLYAGGGGGGSYSSGSAGAGGAGGGGAGGFGTSGTVGEANTGGGGGGSGSGSGVAGGSGIVIIRNTNKSKNKITVNNIDVGYVYGIYTLIDDENGNWRIKFLDNSVFEAISNINIDIFVVGGGGGSGHYYGSSGGGGGGGGYTNTYSNISVTSGSLYQIVVGEGGIRGSSGNISYFGTATTYFANGGGAGGDGGVGGDGGSGGGRGANKSIAGAGGSLGNNGGINSAGNTVSTGQGYTTCEFGQGTLSECNVGVIGYSGGGGGATYSSGSAGAGGLYGGGAGGFGTIGDDGIDNTGGGAGAGGSSNSSFGGSGIVVIRNAR